VLKSQSANIKFRLKEAINGELPGEKAHRLMLPKGRDLSPSSPENEIIQSSVLLVLFPQKGKINTCLIRRASTMKNHAGQIAFPGGRYENTDKDLIDTALRESFEEIGIESDKLEILGSLTPLYVQVSNFIINPFIAWCDNPPDFKIDNREVDEIFIIPIEKFLLKKTNQIRKVYTSRGPFNVPGYYIKQLFIWGATAMIISEFKEIYLSLK
jgi:8-oxo-dGTP pyrophosphatase MutT (NUDIX family)